MEELKQAVKKHGGLQSFGRALGVSYQSVQYMIANGVPPRRVLAVERLTGIRREVLRPDIYPPEDRL